MRLQPYYLNDKSTNLRVQAREEVSYDSDKSISMDGDCKGWKGPNRGNQGQGKRYSTAVQNATVDWPEAAQKYWT